ncbi:FitA-like ribbon-helix-helix domain-containing protein [Floridanema aerugineum]|uniref:Antitoxin FitA-like ribbon-helix-helix domain-containing protein n=1 Tax=Floridaenema aerugineum BLCC-F46 TaxID=3153654 RepID=A0ABV4XAH0_9CYAN
MAQIILDNIHPDVLEKIRNLAQKHNQSLEDEIKSILAQATAEIPSQPSVRASFRERLAEARQRHGNKLFSDSVELLREDRNR